MRTTRRRLLRAATAGAGLALVPGMGIGAKRSACSSLLDHSIRPLMGSEPVHLCNAYAHRVLLIVNTASKCGFTHQFEGLEALHQRYHALGLAVLGFPSEDFRQELDSEAAVAEFCKLNYGVSFPMFQKVRVRGTSAHPLYAGLAAAAGGFPSWNFNKYLVNRQGEVQQLYGSSDEPLGNAITTAIETLI